MNLISLENEIKQCNICKSILEIYNINPKPIFSGFKKADILLIGQAPGITEYKVGKPFQGSAGESIKKLFKECGLHNFDDLVYQKFRVRTQLTTSRLRGQVLGITFISNT